MEDGQTETASATPEAERDALALELRRRRDEAAALARDREPDAIYLVTQAQLDELARIFGAVGLPPGGQYERAQHLGARARDLAFRMLAWCPESRERELAIRCLDQAVMWSAAAMARGE